MHHSSSKEAMIVIMHRVLTRRDAHVCCHEVQSIDLSSTGSITKLITHTRHV